MRHTTDKRHTPLLVRPAYPSGAGPCLVPGGRFSPVDANNPRGCTQSAAVARRPRAEYASPASEIGQYARIAGRVKFVCTPHDLTAIVRRLPCFIR